MRPIILAGLIALALVGHAAAGYLQLLGAGGPPTGAPPPPSCSNGFDLSQACNSQFLFIF